jgi:hypothetical protein
MGIHGRMLDGGIRCGGSAASAADVLHGRRWLAFRTRQRAFGGGEWRLHDIHDPGLCLGYGGDHGPKARVSVVCMEFSSDRENLIVSQYFNISMLGHRLSSAEDFARASGENAGEPPCGPEPDPIGPSSSILALAVKLRAAPARGPTYP